MKRRLRQPPCKFAVSLRSSRASSPQSSQAPKRPWRQRRSRKHSGQKSRISCCPLLTQQQPPGLREAGWKAPGRRLRAPRPSGQRRREVPAATAPAKPGAAGSHLPGRPPLAAGGAASARQEGVGTRRGRGSNASSPPLPDPRRPAPPRLHPPTNCMEMSAPMQICRGLGFH